jgi:hypothetical protein
MSLCEPTLFQSVSHPGYKVSYLHLNAGAAHTLLFCYGAAGSSVMLNLFRPFLESHTDLSLLCVDRWTQGEDVARSGLQLFLELREITLELLDVLNIGSFSIAAHSAGVYQLLDLAMHAGVDRVTNLFLMSPHIPEPYTNSRIMKWMCTMPNGLFKTITKLDSMLGNTWAGNLLVGIFSKEENIGDSKNALVAPRELQQLVSQRNICENNEKAAGQERCNIDYRIGYQRLDGISNATLTKLYRDCSTRTTWFTTNGEVFFGPESVHRIVQDIRKPDWEIVVLAEGTHADIYFRSQVWDRMYSEIAAGSLQPDSFTDE